MAKNSNSNSGQKGQKDSAGAKGQQTGKGQSGQGQNAGSGKATTPQTIQNKQLSFLGPQATQSLMSTPASQALNKASLGGEQLVGTQGNSGGGGGGLVDWMESMLIPSGYNPGILAALEPMPGVSAIGAIMGEEADKVVAANPDKVFMIDGKPAGAFVNGKIYSAGGNSFSEVDTMKMMGQLSKGNMNLNSGDIARLNDGGEFKANASANDWYNQMLGGTFDPRAASTTPTTPGTTTPTTPTREETIAKVRQTALTNAMLAAHNRGLNPDDYSSLFGTEIDRIIGQASDVTDPTSLFTPNFGNTTLDTEQGRRRSVYGNEIQNYAPAGFETSRIASTADDDIISKILAEQEAPARTYLDYAKARGNLNDVGYNTGLQDLAGQRTAGGSTLTSIGDAILGRYRGDLLGAKDKGVQGAAGYTLGQTFDPNAFNTGLDTMTGERLAGLEGDIRGSAGSSGLFDTSRLLSRAGTQQGAQNETGALFDVLANRRQTRADRRGLGSRGEF